MGQSTAVDVVGDIGVDVVWVCPVVGRDVVAEGEVVVRGRLDVVVDELPEIEGNETDEEAVPVARELEVDGDAEAVVVEPATFEVTALRLLLEEAGGC